MDRQFFRKMFKTAGPAVLPVIQVINYQQVAYNVAVAMREGAHGVFLSNNEFDNEELIPIIREVRIRFQWLWFGVNFVDDKRSTPLNILSELEQQGLLIDAHWSHTTTTSDEAAQWSGMQFSGAALDSQVLPKNYRQLAHDACNHSDVVTTSVNAGREDSDFGKIQTFRDVCGDHPLAMSSGLSADNIAHYAPLLDAILIADNIMHDDDTYNIDAQKLSVILRKSRESSFAAN